MTLRKNFANTMATALLAVMAFGAHSSEAAIADYVGFGWEAGGIASSLPGDELAIATVVTQIDAIFGVDLNTAESTLYIDGLVSQGGTFDSGTGNTIIRYTGGTLRLYVDPSQDHDWGTTPANGTVPGTFVDGDLLFEGAFTNFTVILQPSGGGIFEGYLDGIGGSALDGPCAGCAYTFAGVFTGASGAQIPDGYDMQVDGQLDIESAVANETINWGSLKNLYR